MAKGDDAVMRKRSRAQRKRSRSLQSKESVSARVAAIIASKRRRKSGKRRICEGMCFTLPTPEDPFNDHNDPKVKKKMQRTTNKNQRKKDVGASVSRLLNKCAQKSDNGEKAEMLLSSEPASAGNKDGKQLRGRCEKTEGDGDSDYRLSKCLRLCLKAIQDAWSQDSEMDDGHLDYGGMGRKSPHVAYEWGINFWRVCSSGLDVVDSSGSCASREQVAWLVSTAWDIIVRKEKEDFVFSIPFLLFLVPSQEKTVEIRSICKPLKALGVHTVSLHQGASLDHQIHGLKSCEPELIVSTPERLLDLVTLKALDISGVSLLVIDGLESFIVAGFLNELNCIGEHISNGHQTVVFGGKNADVSSVQVQKLLKKPICRFSLHGPVTMEEH